MVTMFSFKDAVHDHITIGFTDGCIACAQTQADMALSKRAFAARAQSSRSGNEVVSGNAPEPVLTRSAA